MTASVYTIYGTTGSPYSMKMRALLRYRRLPLIWVQDFRDGLEVAREQGLPPVVPVIRFPDGSFHNDSTPMVHELERRHPGERSVRPTDPGQAFLAGLVEDFADEWLTKIMFLYRWWRERDQRACSRALAFDTARGAGRAEIDALAEGFRERQMARMPLVGCTEANRPLLEATYLELLDILENHVVERRPYLFGARPSLAEFGLFGQLSQLGGDPTPRDVMLERAPFLHRWLTQVDDLSGEAIGEWDPADAAPDDTVVRLLRLIGEIYLPFLAANGAAHEKGEAHFAVTLRGQSYEQGTFKYQAKCLHWLRQALAELDAAARERLRPLLTETGCWPILAGG